MALLQHINSLTYWFTIEISGSKLVSSACVAGANEEYIIQEQSAKYRTLKINWEGESSSEDKEVIISPTTNIDFNGRIVSDWSDNLVLTSRTIIRFNIKKGQSNNQQEYNVVKGSTYSYPMVAYQKVYVFVASMSTISKFYRLQSETTNDVKEFDTGENSRAYGVLYGTPWIVISLLSSNQRKLYDYTNGYIGGSSSATSTHTKLRENFERVFMSPEDERNYYVTYANNQRYMITTNALDGSEHLAVHLSTLGEA